MSIATRIQAKERPILFSGAMVRAILEGRKTQTRRVVKPQPEVAQCVLEPSQLLFKIPVKGAVGTYDMLGLNNFAERSPYGQPGDRLWVRETWAQVHPCQIAEGRFSLEGRAGIPGPPPVKYRAIYRAEGEYPRLHFGPTDHPYRTVCVGDECPKDHTHPEESWHGWTPAIHMPRWASRISLEIVKVRVERVKDITKADALAEGISVLPLQDSNDPSAWYQSEPGVNQSRSAEECYRKLWDSINGKKLPWESNPWVWVIEFKRVQS